MATDYYAALGVRRDAPPDDVCKTLIDLALERGGRDNVTVVVARYHIPEAVDPAEDNTVRTDKADG